MHSLQQYVELTRNKFQPYLESFPALIEPIFSIEKDLLEEIQRIGLSNKNLSIGIIGQVKAGKSSLLNTLLFNGASILPTAATPKTANLTRICYGEEPMLVVHFYEREEWLNILKYADDKSDHLQAKVAQTLKQMVIKHQVDVEAMLEKRELTFIKKNIQELVGELNQFVGDNGHYTAMVKSIDISLPLIELKGLEIIDTPGMNDPIPSRTQKTRDYMARCDVVLFLSRCSQFLDQSDMELLGQQLPSKGVKRIILIAGQLDSVIVDDGYHRNSLQETEDNIQLRLKNRTVKEIEKLATLRENLGDEAIANLLREIKSPIFISAYAHGYANWGRDQWTDGMIYMHEQLKELADENWHNYQFSFNDWNRIGNIETITKIFQQAKKDKEILLHARLNDLMPRTKINLERCLDDLIKSATHRMYQLEKNDIEKIEKDLAVYQQKIDQLVTKLNLVFTKNIERVKKCNEDLKITIKTESNTKRKLETHVETRENVRHKSISTAVWYKPWTWFSEETITETFYTTHKYVITADLIENLVNYGKDIEYQTNKKFQQTLNQESLRNELKKVLLDTLNLEEQAEHLFKFHHILEATINNLSIQEIKLESRDYSQEVSNKFGDYIEGENKIRVLQQTFTNLIEKICGKTCQQMDAAISRLERSLLEAQHQLKEKFISNLKFELAVLEKSFQQKQLEIQNCKELIEVSLEQKSDLVTITKV